MKQSAENLTLADNGDQFIREVELSRKIGLGLTAIRKAERMGLIRAYRPLGTRAKVYYWPEVKEGIMTAAIERPAAGARYTIPAVGGEIRPNKRSREWFG